MGFGPRSGASESFSTCAFLEPARDRACFRVWYTYNNEPQARFRHRSSLHEGVSYLDFDPTAPARLTGRYYTNRKTTGDMAFTRVSTSRDRY